MAKRDQSQECYARALGGCSEQISREHYFSEGVLKCIGGPMEGNAKVYGWNLAHPKLPLNEPLEIGKLSAGILCEKHNNDLHTFDDAGKVMCEAAESLHAAARTRDRVDRTLPVNGDDFERWMLKTLCGSLYSGRVWGPLADWKGVEPPVDWLDILYNKAIIPDGRGIYWQPTDYEGLTRESRRDASFQPLISADGRAVIGMQAWFYGLRFDLVIGDPAPSAGTAYQRTGYRPSFIVVDGCGTTIRFDWKHGWHSPVILSRVPD
jgi:hypothetical protein